MIRFLAATLLGIVFACSIHLGSAQAQRSRVFVASYGSDGNPCTFLSPCRTFQQAVNVVLAGGEVTAIDSAGFGPISISHAVTITSPEGVEPGIVPNPGGNAVTINAASSDAVILRGLSINGGNSGYNGIVFNSGGSLTVTNCFVQNFAYDGSHPTTGNGILIQPVSGTVNLTITNSVVTNNALYGIVYMPQGTPTLNGVIDNVTATGNQYGIIAQSSGTALIAVSNSEISNNTVDGLYASNAASQSLTVSVDHVSIVGNASVGIDAETTSNVVLGRSVITGNNTGVLNNTSNTFYTYQDNRIFGNNTTNVSSGLNPSLQLQ